MSTTADEIISLSASRSATENSNGDGSAFNSEAEDLYNPLFDESGPETFLKSLEEFGGEPLPDGFVRDGLSCILRELLELRAQGQRVNKFVKEIAELKETVAELDEENRKLREAVDIMDPSIYAAIDSNDELREYILDAKRRQYKNRDETIGSLGIYKEPLVKMVDRFEYGQSPGEATELRIGALLNTLTKNETAPLYVSWIQKKLKGLDGKTLTDRQMKTLKWHLKRDSRFEVKRCPGHVKNWIWEYRNLAGLKGEFVWLAGQDVDWRGAKV